MAIFKRKKKDPQTVQVKGIQLECPVCRNRLFWERRVQLNSSILTFLNLDWLDSEATCFICSECTHIIWFAAHR